MRHLEVKDLWLQELVQRGRLVLGKVRGQLNVADVLTKYLDLASVQKLLAIGGIQVVAVDRHDCVEGGCEFPSPR